MEGQNHLPILYIDQDLWTYITAFTLVKPPQEDGPAQKGHSSGDNNVHIWDKEDNGKQSRLLA